MYKLSIIIPIYNVEAYLPQCLDSILVDNQFTGEVICVNDGSTDGSLHILEEYVTKYPNIQIITQPNGGLSAARNTGIRNATREYVLFLDSDDYLLPNVIDNVLKDIMRYHPEVMCCNVSINGKEPCIDPYLDIPNGISGTEFVERFYRHYHFGYPTEVWHYICERTFLLQNNLWNKEGFLHEDEDFTPRLLLCTKKMLFHPSPILCYRVLRPGAISATKTKRNILHKFKIACDLLEYFDNYNGPVSPIFYEMLYVLAIDTAIEAKNANIEEWKQLQKLLPKIAKTILLKRSAQLAQWNIRWAQLYFYGKMPRWFRKIVNLIFY